MREAREPAPYREMTSVELFNRRIRVLDLTREIGPDLPVYPGHMKTNFWWHMTHRESKLRIGEESAFRGYGVKGIVMCDHISTHVDAVYHFNADRPDLTVDTIPLETLLTPAAWIDLSFAKPRTNITLQNVKDAMAEGGVDRLERGSSFLYYTGAAERWGDPLAFVTQYPGLDSEASHWILDQGVVNVLTDAPSTDNPADLSYHNHKAHGERLVIHTEIVANINKIPRHTGFYLLMAPLRLKGCTGSPVRALALWEE